MKSSDNNNGNIAMDKGKKLDFDAILEKGNALII